MKYRLPDRTSAPVTLTRRQVYPLLFAILLLLASCATLPPPKSSEEMLSALPPESTFFASVNVDTAGGLVLEVLDRVGLTSRTVDKFWARTERLFVAVQLSPAGPPAISAISMGSYPLGLIRFQLNTSKEWKKIKSDTVYWQHRRENLQIAVPESNLILIPSGSMERILHRLENPLPMPVPEEVIEAMESSSLVIYFPVLPTTPQMQNLPIQTVWLSLLRNRDNGQDGGLESYDLKAVFYLSEGKDPRILAMLFRLLVMIMMRNAEMDNVASRLKALEITVDEARVRLSGLNLNTEELLRAAGELLGSDPL